MSVGLEELETIRYEEDGAVARIWLARPERRNALDIQVWREISAALETAETSDRVRTIVIGADGPVFCAGQNLKFTQNATEAQKWNYDEVNLATRERIRKLRKAVVARVQGSALGGGCYLALSCDLVVAVTGAEFALREIHAGEESGGALLLSVGRARAMEASLLGRPISSEEAMAWGLINRTVDSEKLDAAVASYVAELSKLPPLAVEFTKASQNALLDSAGFASHLEQAMLRNRFLFRTEDAQEARRAFVEKRSPRFNGR